MWPLAHAVEALTTRDTKNQARLFQELLLMAEGNGLVHESVHVDSPHMFRWEGSATLQNSVAWDQGETMQIVRGFAAQRAGRLVEAGLKEDQGRKG